MGSKKEMMIDYYSHSWTWRGGWGCVGGATYICTNKKRNINAKLIKSFKTFK